MLQPGELLSHDMVQKWIDKAVAGARIPVMFSTHCYHCSGAKYWFMFAPVGQWWTLVHIQWWGRWADGEHVSNILTVSYLGHDMLMCYLLNKLYCYENDHSDGL
ncbi:hypothetical protein EDC04DRAFT_2580041 [Pisolithus marmoratus]|nr:hypothetical protein EDC04DRAFT_2580041 [Pisolithus marmoratus]